MLRPFVSLVICSIFINIAGPVSAAQTDPIGTATTIKNIVNAKLESDTRDLTIGDGVYQNELIEVGDNSIGELVLNDDTMLALGPNTKLLLDKFVYNGERKKGDILLDIVRGSFRFITGVASKKSYRIRTPSASITVRGTIFDVHVEDDGLIWLLLVEGGVNACNDRGECHKMDRPGMLIRVTGDGEVDEPVRWASLEGNDLIDFATAFPFMVNAPNIDPNPSLTKDDVINAKEPARSKPKKKKKTYKSKPHKKKKAKKKYKPKKKYTKKPKPTKKASSGDSLLPLAVGIGVGLAVGGAFKKKKHHHPKPNPGHGNSYDNY